MISFSSGKENCTMNTRKMAGEYRLASWGEALAEADAERSEARRDNMMKKLEIP
jgi:hypothetical protein